MRCRRQLHTWVTSYAMANLLVLALDRLSGDHRPRRDDCRRAWQVCGRRVLPRADRRGKGDDRALRAAADRVEPAARRSRPSREAVQQPGVTDGPDATRRGRTGQALHQHLALHTLRDGQPTLHDGERLRPRLRAHSGRPDVRLPAGQRSAGRRLRGGTVSVEGHHAAGCLQQQQLRARPRRDDGQRGTTAVHGVTAREDVPSLDHDGRPCSACRSRRSRTTFVRA